MVLCEWKYAVSDVEQAINKALKVIQEADQVIHDLWNGPLGAEHGDPSAERQIILHDKMLGALVWYDNHWWVVEIVYGSCYSMRPCTEEEYLNSNINRITMLIQ